MKSAAANEIGYYEITANVKVNVNLPNILVLDAHNVFVLVL